ncbi:hypothetical protein PanWU01x14_367640 [Parasponia andersonii]|uniref:Uncharacterized protein n=1 Tax=Parasponia andersonii TaxID=3476 RepID=A0A2P5A583_PARAD|nr:hypothetical protein PanWU01x14_367640 [Parasponia andersonii]
MEESMNKDNGTCRQDQRFRCSMSFAKFTFLALKEVKVKLEIENTTAELLARITCNMSETILHKS